METNEVYPFFLPWFDKLEYGCMINSEKVEIILDKKKAIVFLNAKF